MTREEVIIDIRDNMKPTMVDCISRQAVLDLIADYDLSMGQVVKGIHALPSVTPQEPRKGHWVHGEYCSECGWNIPAYIIARKWQKYMDTTCCPNCGAKMVELQESEDKDD